MADYGIIYTGHIKQSEITKRFPYEEVYHYQFVGVQNIQALIRAVAEESLTFIQMQGMSTSFDPQACKDPSKLDKTAMFVPIHMISHITAEVRLLTGEMPMNAPDGTQVNLSGKEIVKQ